MTGQNTKRRSSPRRANSPSFLGRGKPGEEPDAPVDGTVEEATVRQGTRVMWLAPMAIRWPDIRITSEHSEESFAGLRKNLIDQGQEDPVIVKQLEDGTYEGAGVMNRCLAALANGTETILCIVTPGTHRDVVRANIATALNQGQPNPLSTAEGIADAYHNEGCSVEELVEMSGRTSSWVGDQLAISEACPAVKQCLGDRQIAIGHAALLAKVDDAAVQEEMLGLLLKHGWSIGQLEEQLRGGPGPSSEPDASAGPRARKSSGSRGPVVCGYCQVEHGPADVQMVAVCSGCASKIGPAPVGEVLVPAGLLREAVSVLAGTQAGAGPAEAFESLLELVESAEEETV